MNRILKQKMIEYKDLVNIHRKEEETKRLEDLMTILKLSHLEKSSRLSNILPNHTFWATLYHLFSGKTPTVNFRQMMEGVYSVLSVINDTDKFVQVTGPMMERSVLVSDCKKEYENERKSYKNLN